MKLPQKIGNLLLYSILIISSFIFLFPFFWMISTSLKSIQQVFTYPPVWFPIPPRWLNYREALFSIFPFMLYFKNTLVISAGVVIGTLVSSSLTAYGFARLKFFGRNFWFAIMLVTLMLPYEVVMVPQYIIFAKLEWLNSLKPLVVPAYFGHPFFIFLLVQFIRTIPRELDEAATIDGCGTFKIYYKIILPLITPALATTAIFSFYWTWDNLLGPVLYLNSPEKYTVSMALNMFLSNETVSNWGAMFAMSIVSLIPVFVIFFIFQRHVVEGISTTGLKG